ncbi:MAG: M23 family metallopeptidase [Spirochaetes bacterium]|nr:M23 family metallopeptidase [Spirochaetota bacterium]
MTVTKALSGALTMLIPAVLMAAFVHCAAQGLNGETAVRRTIRDRENPHRVLHLPSDYQVEKAKMLEAGDDEVAVSLHSRGFSQGDVIYLEIAAKKMDPGDIRVYSARFGDTPVVLVRRGWGYRALVPIQPNHKTGITRLSLSYRSGNRRGQISTPVEVHREDFPSSKIPLDLGKFSNVGRRVTPEVLAYIDECAEKKRRVFSALNPDRLGDGFSHPRDMHHITSQFWSKRLYLQYRYRRRRKVILGTRVNIHRGVDLRGKIGEPVYAMADGLVALADKLYYEGNFVVLDHGNRIFSYYMHMNDLTVKEGTVISAGDMIGHVGSTGISTASHLHVSLVIQGVQVDPLSLLPLPLKR